MERLIHFLFDLLELPVQVYEEGKTGAQVESNHCFSEQVQAQFTADVLETLCTSAREHCLYEIRDVLGLRLILFRFGGQVLLCGPFVEDNWDDERGEFLLAQHGIQATRLLPYKLYYCSYKVIPTFQVVKVLRAALKTFSPDQSTYRYHAILGITQKEDPRDPQSHDVNYDLIVRRYELENKMMQAIRRGNANAAKATLKQMSDITINDKKLNYVLNKDVLTGFGILRTLIRKAAEEGGVHPVTVDAIAGEYEQKLVSCSDYSAYNHINDQMIDDFCDAVRMVKSENYSPIIRKAISFILLHLSEELHIEQISRNIGISGNYLEKMFKEETGETISSYISRQRCEQAAQMLRTTNIRVQEVSYYVGYLDNNYFVKVFRKWYRMTPTQYRKHYSEDIYTD